MRMAEPAEAGLPGAAAGTLWLGLTGDAPPCTINSVLSCHWVLRQLDSSALKAMARLIHQKLQSSCWAAPSC